MTTRHALIGLLGFCAVVLLFAAAGLASDFVTRLLKSVDGLLLLLISALMGGIFSLMAYVLLKETGLFSHRAKQAGQENAAPASNNKSREEQTAGIAS